MISRLDNIVLALQAQFGFGLGLRHAAQFEKSWQATIPPDEALLDIVWISPAASQAVALRLLSRPALRPPDGEEGLLVEQVVRNLIIRLSDSSVMPYSA